MKKMIDLEIIVQVLPTDVSVHTQSLYSIIDLTMHQYTLEVDDLQKKSKLTKKKHKPNFPK
jgi:hypothetical protein